MERKLIKQICWVDGSLLSIVVIAVCWFVLFSPWTRPLVNFWWVLSISSFLVSILAGHFYPQWTLDMDVDKKNFLLGFGLFAVLCGGCYGGSMYLMEQYPFLEEQFDRLHLLYDDSTYYFLAIFLLLLMGQAEEIFWRGYIQRALSERLSPNAGYLITTLLYTLMYAWAFNWALTLGAFVLSLVWGGLCRYNPRWLSPVMLSHMLLNVVFFILFPL